MQDGRLGGYVGFGPGIEAEEFDWGFGVEFALDHFIDHEIWFLALNEGPVPVKTPEVKDFVEVVGELVFPTCAKGIVEKDGFAFRFAIYSEEGFRLGGTVLRNTRFVVDEVDVGRAGSRDSHVG